MTLHAIVAALGGDLYARGLRANIPAPGHSAADRSVSLLLDQGRVIIHCFGAATWREVLDDLRARGLVDRAGALTGGCAPRPADDARRGDSGRLRVVSALWGEAQPIADRSVAARHARRRGVRRGLDRIAALRLHPRASISIYRGGEPSAPALLAAVCDASGDLVGLEVTYLDPDGVRARRIARPRKTVGRVPPGSAVRLDAPGEALLVAEGVFTALSASERFGLPAWALLSAGNLRRWRAPAGVRRVLVAADRGAAGEAAARGLAAGLRADGVRVAIRWPPAPFGDWNDLAAARAPEGGERAGEGARTGGETSRPAGAETDP